MNDKRDCSEDEVENPAFDHLFQLDKPFFRMVCRQMSVHLARMGVPLCDREDLINQALLNAVKHRHRFADDELERRLRCWLMKTVHRLALDRRCRLAKRFCETLDAGIEEPIDEREAKRAALAERSEQARAIVEKVGPGNETNVRLLMGHFLQGYSVPELAQQFGMTPKAVERRIGRLLEQVRPQMKKFSWY